MFEYPPFAVTCGKRLISLCCNLFTGIDHRLLCRRKFCYAALIQYIFVVDHSEIITLNCNSVASCSQFRRLHCICYCRINCIHQWLFGQIIGILTICIDFLSGCGRKDIRNFSGIDLCFQHGRIVILCCFIINCYIWCNALVLINQCIDCICILR